MQQLKSEAVKNKLPSQVLWLLSSQHQVSYYNLSCKRTNQKQ